jgi:hypothetical protein
MLTAAHTVLTGPFTGRIRHPPLQRTAAALTVTSGAVAAGLAHPPTWQRYIARLAGRHPLAGQRGEPGPLLSAQEPLQSATGIGRGSRSPADSGSESLSAFCINCWLRWGYAARPAIMPPSCRHLNGGELNGVRILSPHRGTAPKPTGPHGTIRVRQLLQSGVQRRHGAWSEARWSGLRGHIRVGWLLQHPVLCRSQGGCDRDPDEADARRQRPDGLEVSPTRWPDRRRLIRPPLPDSFHIQNDPVRIQRRAY